MIEIETAIKAAKNSTHKERVGCVITDKKGRIISTGYNKIKSHPIQKKFAVHCETPDKIFLHAEMDALISCEDDPYSIFVVRITRGGNLGMAKPCPICETAIRAFGVKKIFYTDSVGKVCQIDLE